MVLLCATALSPELEAKPADLQSNAVGGTVHPSTLSVPVSGILFSSVNSMAQTPVSS